MSSLIRDLLKLRVAKGELRSLVEKWLALVREVYEQRNAVLHSVWIGNGHAESSHWRAHPDR